MLDFLDANRAPSSGHGGPPLQPFRTVVPNKNKNKNNSNNDNDNKQPFRTLVVVPQSHADGTFERLCSRDAGGKKQVKDASVIRRAVQLDLQPDARSPHESLFVAWNSRVVHQGHTHKEAANGWNPPLHRPKFFAAGEGESDWQGSLKEEGYVVLADVLSTEDVQEALRLLLSDLQLLVPELPSLGEVRERHLPPSAADNDLRGSRGLCHGKFAWFLRSHPNVSQLFESLFSLPRGAPLVGSVDVVALAPPQSSALGAGGKNWLHLDYSPPNGMIWQTCLQLFPRTEELGAKWERIGVMVCKAPAAWASPFAERALLACCVTGAASRATAGVTIGKLHPPRKKEELRPGQRRLLPALKDLPLAAAVAGDEVDPTMCPFRFMAPQEVMKELTLDKLRQLVTPTVLKYVSPLAGASNNNDSSNNDNNNNKNNSNNDNNNNKNNSSNNNVNNNTSEGSQAAVVCPVGQPSWRKLRGPTGVELPLAERLGQAVSPSTFLDSEICVGSPSSADDELPLSNLAPKPPAKRPVADELGSCFLKRRRWDGIASGNAVPLRPTRNVDLY